MNAADCNSLQCPHCGGNVIEKHDAQCPQVRLSANAVCDCDSKAAIATRKRNKRQRESRSARHQAMIACGLVRVRVNGRTFYE